MNKTYDYDELTNEIETLKRRLAELEASKAALDAERNQDESCENSKAAEAEAEAEGGGGGATESVESFDLDDIVEEHVPASSPRLRHAESHELVIATFSEGIGSLDDLIINSSNHMSTTLDNNKKPNSLASASAAAVDNTASLTKNEDDLMTRQPFSQFAYLTIDPEQLLLLGNRYLFADEGPRYLDGFVLNFSNDMEGMEFGQHLSLNDDAPRIPPKALINFCFPNGLRVKCLPRAAVTEGSIEKATPSGHMMVFTDSNGHCTYGVAVTMQWEINLTREEQRDLGSQLTERYEKRMAAARIARWWRLVNQKRILQEALVIFWFFQRRASPAAAAEDTREDVVSTAELKLELAGSEMQFLYRALKKSKNKARIRQGRNKKKPTRTLKELREQIDNLSEIMETVRNALERSPDLSVRVAGASEPDTPTGASAVEANGETKPNKKPKVGLRSSIQRLHRKLDQSLTITPDTLKAYDIVAGRKAIKPMAMYKNKVAKQTLTAYDTLVAGPRSIKPVKKQIAPHTPKALSPITPEFVDDITRAKAKESYETMMYNDALGTVFIVEKCYAVIGCKLEDSALLICALRQLVKSEKNELLQCRECQEDTNDPSTNMSEVTVKRERQLAGTISDRRQGVLEAMCPQLCLSQYQSSISRSFPPSELDFLNRSKETYFETQLSHLPNVEPIKLPLPLPNIGRQWGLSKIILDLGTDSLLFCLKLLLLERSVLVLGDNLQEITAVSYALVELLKPFEWASAFMPVLPKKMLDFVLCPVPFVAGIVTGNAKAIENDYRTQMAMESGLSILNLTTNVLQITSEKGVHKLLSVDPMLREQLDSLAKRIYHLCEVNPESALRDFSTFIENGFTPHEALTMDSMCRVLERYFTRFCGELAVNHTAWKQYGTVNPTTNHYSFQPDWLIQTLQAERDFQDAVIQTQLFSSFVHNQRQSQLEVDELRKGQPGRFIAEWVFQHWRMRNRQ